jgi:hypothetical protein
MHKPSERDLRDEARGRFAEALELYEAVAGAIKRRPLTPGWIRLRGKLTLRGEWVDVPRRFLDLRKPREGYGDVDDQAERYGFEDGDELREYLATCRRPVLAEFVRSEYVNATMPQAERNRTMRERRLEAGLCTRCGKAPAREAKTTCGPCNAIARAAVEASRERKRAPITETERLARGLEKILS